MSKLKVSSDSFNGDKWKKVFAASVKMLEAQKAQLESLAKDREFLIDRIKSQHQRWLSDVKLFQDQIFQMKRNSTRKEMESLIEVKKLNLVMGSKEIEAYIYSRKLEKAENDLADFVECFDHLSHSCSEPNDASSSGKQEQQQYTALQTEVRRLKCANEKLNLEKKSEISALLAEKNFVWNQYNELESKLSDQLRKKHAEIEHANEMISTLLTRVEELQSSNTEKDNATESLKNDMARMESDSSGQRDEIARLSRELELLKKSRADDLHTPVLRQCSASRSQSSITVKKELGASQTLEEGSRQSKRRENVPKLFTSSFKVPKLRSSSSPNVG